MANQESFIDEVNDEVRRDRLFALMRRYGWIAITLVVLLVAGAAFNEYRKASQRADAEALGNSVLAALEIEAPSERAEALAAIDVEGTPDAEALLTLMAAGASLDADSPAAATAELNDLAARGDVSPTLRDLAALKAAMIAGQTVPAEDRIARLEPLTLPGAPFRLLALEQVALAEVDRGDPEAAIERFTEILNDNATSEGLRRRAAQMIVALGGTPGGS